MYSSKLVTRARRVTCHKDWASLSVYLVKEGSKMSFFGFGAFSTPVGQLIGELLSLLALPVHT